MTLSRILFAALALLLAAAQFVGARPAAAQDDAFAAAVNQLGNGFGAQVEAINQLGALADARAVPLLRALGDGALAKRNSDNRIAILRDDGPVDAISGERLQPPERDAYAPIGINNRVRVALRGALGRLVLFSPDDAERQAAAEGVYRTRAADNLPLIERALAAERNPRIKDRLELALAATQLMSDDQAVRRSGIATLGASSSPEARPLLVEVRGSATDAEFIAAVDAALAALDWRLRMASWGQTLFQGLSLGSVLLLAALGLAITFGVMGVINMAHGEMVMLGAYTTYFVQEIFRARFPGLVDYSILFAIPISFVVVGAFGVALERGLIRFLYGRPLDTLLMTFGLGMIIQQTVRLSFGAQNRDVISPSWLQGNIVLPGGIAITQNRLWIIFFGLAVLLATLLVIRLTRFGLYMRAVTQNRPIAATMGIGTGGVDALTFGFGSGLAGLAGVALSQIDNVSPNLGTGYIIDSFMVVVFGGVGNLAGTLVGSLLIGVVNKVLEPFAGAVLGKIFVLVAIILFIQRRPRGLFALRGRFVES
jgi:urea transport system permease protein